MNRTHFLSLTAAAVLILLSSIGGPRLGALDSPPETQGSVRQSSAKYNEIAMKIHDFAPPTLSEPLPGPQESQAAICSALHSQQSLRWNGQDITNLQLRSLLSLQPNSKVSCSFTPKNRLQFVEVMRPPEAKAEGSKEGAHPPNEDEHGKYSNEMLGARLDQAAIAVDPHFQLAGHIPNPRAKRMVCRALTLDHNLNWRNVLLSPSQLRAALALQANTNISCFFAEEAIILAETPQDSLKEFKASEIVERLGNPALPGSANIVDRIPDRKRQELCQALEGESSLRWGEASLTPLELRRAFGISQPHPSRRVQCSFRDGALNLSETGRLQSAPLPESPKVDFPPLGSPGVASPGPTPRATKTKETSHPNEGIARRLQDVSSELDPAPPIGFSGLPSPLVASKRTAICTALHEDRTLRWTPVDLQPHQLRAALFLQPHSIVACSHDSYNMKFIETGFVSAASPLDPKLREVTTNYKLGDVREIFDQLNAPSRDIETEGISWDAKKKIALCRAMATDTSFRWGSRMITQAQLRRMFSLQPASEVRCTYERGVMTLTERK